MAAVAATRRLRRLRRPARGLAAAGPAATAPAALAPAAGCRRIRTGFFAEDADFIDPEAPLLADRLGMRWRYMDDAALRAPLLERSNVGMGMLVINRPEGLDLPVVNEAYRRLRNLEVNSLKRFVGLAATEPGPFCLGLEPKELLLAAVSGMQFGRLPRFSRALLWHRQELAHLVADFRKPVVCQLSGVAKNDGAALACLASFSGAYDESEVSVDSCLSGLVPDGGLCYVLARLRWRLGEFLALTGWPIRGPDLVYLGLVRHWLSPEALPFLELTAEKHLEVSETDSRALLGEHSLAVPEGLGDGDSLPRWAVPLINEAFSKDSVPKIIEALEHVSSGGAEAKKKLQQEGRDKLEEMVRNGLFADDCLARLRRAEPLALHTTLELIRRAKGAISRETRDADESVPGKYGERGALVEVLRLELRAQQRLLCSRDAAVGLRARCLGEVPRPVDWSRRDSLDVVADEVKRLLNERPAPGEAQDFVVPPRSDISLSQHPRLRRYHPDYDAVTGLDHDPEWMAAEVRRWSPDFFAEERRQALERILGGRDPAEFGLSRYARAAP